MKPVLRLDPAERAALGELRDHSPKAYLRERAAALLKLADGVQGATVARSGLLRRRDPDTIYHWRDRYKRHGLAGLRNRPGAGRKPAFPPSGGAPRPRVAPADRRPGP